ncbi:MAG: AraC family transcriptional regulator [Pseudomonadota bacterium]
MGEAEILTHGTDSERMTTVPRFGRTIDHGQVSIDLVPSKPLEVHFKADRDVITLPFSPCSVWGSYNGGKRRNWTFGPGQIAVYARGAEGYAIADRVTPELIAISFDESFRNRVFGQLSDTRTAYESGLGGQFHVTNSNAFATTVRQMHLSGMIDSTLVAESLVVTLLRSAVGAIDGTSATTNEPNRTIVDPATVDRLRDYIMDDLTRDLSLDELASLAGISPFHFARAFKQATGLSPHQYVLELRLTRAREELAGGKNTLADIAYAVGFSSQAHMTDVFKKRLGVTPGRYRKDLAA